MNFFGNLLHIRCLLLFFAVGLMTTTLSAQAVSQNVKNTILQTAYSPQQSAEPLRVLPGRSKR